MSTSHHNFKNGPNFLSMDQLKEKILACPYNNSREILSTVKKYDLLSYCRNHNLITGEELLDSTPVRYSVVKTYLSQIIQDQNDLNQLQDYVRVQSLLFIRSTRIQNLVAHSILDIPFGRRIVKDQSSYPWRYSSDPYKSKSEELFNLLFSRSFKLEFLKQCYLPESYINRSNSSTKLDDRIRFWLESLGEALTPPDWIGVMSKTGWGNVINNHATLMQANIQNMIKAKLLSLAKLYISKLQWNVSQAMLEKLLVKPWPEVEDIPQEFHQDTIEIIYSIRQACKIDDDEYFNSVEELTLEGFNLYIHFARIGIQNREILPLATFNRKYSYLDNQIAKQLFGKPKVSKKPKLQTESSSSDVANVFNTVFNLSRDAFNQRRKNTRNLRRSKKQKGKRHGFKGLPVWTNIKSLKTDGIGVSLTLSKPITIPRTPGRIFVSDKPLLKPKEWKEQRCEQMRNEDTIRPIFIGVDTGRAKLYTASIEQVDDIESKTCTFTRGLYYWEMGHHKRKAFEKQYRENRPQLVEAYNALSDVGKLYSLPDRLQVEAQYKAVLIEESVGPVERAVWRMRGHRWKRSSLDRAANRLIDAAKPFRDSQRVVIGIGSGVFPSGGRGEKSVPLKGMEQAIFRARSRRVEELSSKGRTNRIDILKVDEFRTTCKCSNCEGQTIRAPPIFRRSRKYPSSRLRLCKKCNEHVGKLIDRDVNGARNILKCTIAEYFGQPRPSYLQRPKRGQPEDIPDD